VNVRIDDLNLIARFFFDGKRRLRAAT
jgi:hypothetical protein